MRFEPRQKPKQCFRCEVSPWIISTVNQLKNRGRWKHETTKKNCYISEKSSVSAPVPVPPMLAVVAVLVLEARCLCLCLCVCVCTARLNDLYLFIKVSASHTRTRWHMRVPRDRCRSNYICYKMPVSWVDILLHAHERAWKHHHALANSCGSFNWLSESYFPVQIDRRRRTQAIIVHLLSSFTERRKFPTTSRSGSILLLLFEGKFF